MEPRLVIIHDDKEIQQIFVCAENNVIMEVPTNKFIDGIVHLMAAYYVFNVQYPNFCKPTLQDIIMNMNDKGRRPTRYSTFISHYLLTP